MLCFLFGWCLLWLLLFDFVFLFAVVCGLFDAVLLVDVCCGCYCLMLWLLLFDIVFVV